MAITTIKVPVELRERISASAKARGVPAATLLTEALDELDRQQRWAAVGAAFAALGPDDDYWDEVRAWDALSAGAQDE